MRDRDGFRCAQPIILSTRSALRNHDRFKHDDSVTLRPALQFGIAGSYWRGVMRSKLTTIILIGMVRGILVGRACNTLWPDPKTAKTIADYISLFTDIFLRLIKMIIAPLVFSTLVVGVAHMGDTKAVGRI